MSWEFKKVSELCIFAIDCVNKTAPIVDYETPYKMIRTTNVKKGFIDVEDVRYVEKETFLKWTRRSRPRYGDVILTREAPVGSVGRYTSKDENVFLGQRLFHYRPDPNLLDWRFLTYILQSEAVQGWIQGIAFGATVPHIKVEDAEELKIPCPPINIQRRIGDILSAYDDLIENNLKQIKLLEEMAQITYQEWFVRLKFPNHENTPMDEKTGLPVGWEKRKIKNLCADIADGTHDSPKEVNNGIKLITGKHINDGFIDFENAYLISKEDHEQIKKRSGLNKGDILFSNIGTLGSIGVVTQDFEFSCKNVIIFKYKQGYSHFLYTYLANENTKNKLSAQSAGVAQKFYSLNFIRNFEDFLPTNDLIELFDEKFSNIYALKYQLHEQNQLLKEARDILLPRLMTGKITV